MSREVVSSLAYRAYPNLESEVYLTMGIEDSLTLLARYWLILNQSHVFYLLQRGVDSTNRYYHSLFIDFIARPIVPGEPKSILNFSLVEIHFPTMIFLFNNYNF